MLCTEDLVCSAKSLPLHLQEHKLSQCPFLLIAEPFQHITMGLIRSPQCRLTGYRSILITYHYAIRYSGAFPLRGSKRWLAVVVQLFSRAGFPEEILTDQGTNFASNVMQLLHKNQRYQNYYYHYSTIENTALYII